MPPHKGSFWSLCTNPKVVVLGRGRNKVQVPQVKIRSVDGLYEKDGEACSAFQRKEVIEWDTETHTVKVIGYWNNYKKAHKWVDDFNRKQEDE